MPIVSKSKDNAFILDKRKIADFFVKKTYSSSDAIKRFDSRKSRFLHKNSGGQ